MTNDSRLPELSKTDRKQYNDPVRTIQERKGSCFNDAVIGNREGIVCLSGTLSDGNSDQRTDPTPLQRITERKHQPHGDEESNIERTKDKSGECLPRQSGHAGYRSVARTSAE